ncbi:ribosomal 40S subunit protein S13 [Curvularia kusanoi]|uniref:Ribosomal 40S subunit protein S13 n=1 Tax=Curvularia kusanoi TaxID=90978 RepID=A0A9P4W7M6_CURKU|nr:ribosomal 40S subunit protein S13 [Curvularia kusanoi]
MAPTPPRSSLEPRPDNDWYRRNIPSSEADLMRGLRIQNREFKRIKEHVRSVVKDYDDMRSATVDNKDAYQKAIEGAVASCCASDPEGVYPTKDDVHADWWYLALAEIGKRQKTNHVRREKEAAKQKQRAASTPAPQPQQLAPLLPNSWNQPTSLPMFMIYTGTSPPQNVAIVESPQVVPNHQVNPQESTGEMAEHLADVTSNDHGDNSQWFTLLADGYEPRRFNLASEGEIYHTVVRWLSESDADKEGQSVKEIELRKVDQASGERVRESLGMRSLLKRWMKDDQTFKVLPTWEAKDRHAESREANTTTEPPLTDADAARKARINSDIVRECCKEAPPNTDPTLYSVGSYTHTASARNASDRPITDKSDPKIRFLSIGGPNKIPQSKHPVQTDKEVAAVYEELQRAIEAQGKPSSVGTKPLPYLQAKHGNATPATSATPLAGAISQLAVRDRGMKRTHSDVAGSKASEPQPKRRHGYFRGRYSSYNCLLKSNGLAPGIPEDLYMLIKKAVAVRKHLSTNRKDKDSKFRLILIKSRIHGLSRYYETVGALPTTWRV